MVVQTDKLTEKQAKLTLATTHTLIKNIANLEDELDLAIEMVNMLNSGSADKKLNSVEVLSVLNEHLAEACDTINFLVNLIPHVMDYVAKQADAAAAMHEQTGDTEDEASVDSGTTDEAEDDAVQCETEHENESDTETDVDGGNTEDTDQTDAESEQQGATEPSDVDVPDVTANEAASDEMTADESITDIEDEFEGDCSGDDEEFDPECHDYDEESVNEPSIASETPQMPSDATMVDDFDNVMDTEGTLVE